MFLVQATGITDAIAIGTGAGRACAKAGLFALARLYCWGDNGDGQLGLGDNVDRLTAQQVGLLGGAASVWASATPVRALPPTQPYAAGGKTLPGNWGTTR